jgi:hypothetical protein
LLLAIARGSGTSSHTITVNSPGWTAIWDTGAGGTRDFTFWHIAGSETSVSVTFPNGNHVAAALHRITGARISSPVDASNVKAIAAGGPWTTNSITVTAQRAALFGIFGTAGNGITWTPPASQTELTDQWQGTSNGVSQETAWEIVTSGATGTRTAVPSSTSFSGFAGLIAIAELPGGSGYVSGTRDRWGRFNMYHKHLRTSTDW